MQSNYAPNGMVVTPHHLATQTAVSILRAGGTAMEAMVAAAATIAVVYPHMNGIGGDGFWLIFPPNGDPVAIEACGAAGSLATKDFFKGLDQIPFKGPKAAITVAGTVGGWQQVLEYVRECGYQKISTSTLLADAINYAEIGFAVTKSHRNSLLNVQNVTSEFDKVFRPCGKTPAVGDRFVNKKLAKTLKYLAENGLDSYYRGEIGNLIAEDMAAIGMPITASDLANYTAVRKTPLRLLHKLGDLYNIKPPSQGVISLLILGILDKLNIDFKSEGEFVHTVVEATKQAFKIRDEYITDPKYMTIDPQSLLTSSVISRLASNISLDRAATADEINGLGDTIWMGAMDNKGFTVAFIQSLFQDFGSGVLLPKTGILWHNRGVSFNLNKGDIREVKPGKKPFHTLNLGAAKFHDGRTMIYGTRGGAGQPQTQAAIFQRYAVQKMNLQTSVSAPRWIYGNNFERPFNNTLNLEGRFNEETINYLKSRGHTVNILPDYSETVGQAGALVRHVNGMIEGAFDPRSDGSAAGF